MNPYEPQETKATKTDLKWFLWFIFCLSIFGNVVGNFLFWYIDSLLFRLGFDTGF